MQTFPKHSPQSISYQIGENQANRFHIKLQKNICKQFQPYKQYYHQYPIQYLINPKINYLIPSSYQWKNQLIISRQLQYLRGHTLHYFQEEYIQHAINEDLHDRGLLQNHQNKSIILNNLIIIASDTYLKSIILSSSYTNSQQQEQHLVFHQFPQKILEIQLHQLNHIIVRCRYYIFLFDINENNIKIKHIFKQQITAFKYFNNNKQCILVSTFDNSIYRLYQWNINNNDIKTIRSCSNYLPIHSLINLNSRQFILGFSNKIIIEDLRTNTNQLVKQLNQLINDRYISLGSVSHVPYQYVLSKSKNIQIFQLRQPKCQLLSVRHFCQESPPSCLVNFNWIQPYIIAYSPQYLGSSLLLSLNNLKQISSFKSIYNIKKHKPILLFDSGKLYKQLYPKTISIKIQDDILKIIHVDNCDGIALQSFKKFNIYDQNIGRLKSNHFNGYPLNLHQQWVNQKVLEPFITRKPMLSTNNYHSQQQEQQQSIQDISQIPQKNINYCTLNKFRNKIQHLSKIQKQKNKNSQIIDTYCSQSLNNQYQQNQIQIDKNKFHHSNKIQSIINLQLLNYLDKQWKV